MRGHRIGRASVGLMVGAARLTTGCARGDDDVNPRSAAASTLVDVPVEDAPLAAEVSGSFFTTTTNPQLPEWRPSVTQAEADCIGNRLVRDLGAARVRALRLGEAPWHLLGYALSVEFERAEAEQIVDALAACTGSWELLMISSVTSGAERISDESARCTGDRLADVDARAVFVAELDRAYDEGAPPGGQPSLVHLDPLLAALDACLTSDELDALDWN
jgi:hypothetical protein